MIGCKVDQYFDKLCSLVTDEKGMEEYATFHEPLYEGANPIHITVLPAIGEAKGAVLVCNESTSEEELSSALRGIFANAKNERRARLSGIAGINFYRKYTVRSCEEKRAIGEAHLAFGSVSKALPYFQGLKDKWLEYGVRMAEYCNIMLRSPQENVLFCLDFYILAGYYGLLYKSLPKLSESLKEYAEELLVARTDSQKVKLFLTYSMLRRRDKRPEHEGTSEYKESLRSSLSKLSEGSASPARRDFWSKILSSLE